MWTKFNQFELPHQELKANKNQKKEEEEMEIKKALELTNHTNLSDSLEFLIVNGLLEKENTAKFLFKFNHLFPQKMLSNYFYHSNNKAKLEVFIDQMEMYDRDLICCLKGKNKKKNYIYIFFFFFFF